MKKFKPNVKQTKIHVYLNNHRQVLKLIQQKYKISISTIAEIAAKEITNKKYYTTLLSEEKISTIATCYYTSEKLTNDITIKPKIKYDYIDQLQTHNKQIFFTNVLYHVATKFKHLELEEEQRNKLYNNVNNEFNKRKETYWDLNNQIRTNKRSLEILGAKKQ